MRARLAFAALALVPSVNASAQAQTVRIDRPATPVRVQLDAMPLGALVTLLMRDIMKVPYVIAPDVLQDRRPMSVNLVLPRAEIASRVVGFLRGVGLDVNLVGGTVYVARKGFGPGGAGGQSLPGQIVAPNGQRPSLPASIERNQGTSLPGVNMTPAQAPGSAPGAGSPIPGHVPQLGHGSASATGFGPIGVERVVAIVSPAHRLPGELARVIEPVIPGVLLSASDESRPRGFSIDAPSRQDALVISGAEPDVDQALGIIQAIDVPRAGVEISAAVLEVSSNQVRGSALALIADLLGGKIGVASNAAETAGPQVLRLAVGGVSAALSAVREDGRFRVLSEPTVRVQSGAVAVLKAGSEVPTLGAVTFQENSAPVRSVVYRNSGITLNVQPSVVAGRIHLDVDQERSSFARTNTGVDDSPTLNQTAISSSFVVEPGETVSFAGLRERSQANNRSGIFGGLLGTREKSDRQSETVILLQARLLPGPAKGEAVVRIIRNGATVRPGTAPALEEGHKDDLPPNDPGAAAEASQGVLPGEPGAVAP